MLRIVKVEFDARILVSILILWDINEIAYLLFKNIYGPFLGFMMKSGSDWSSRVEVLQECGFEN